MTRVRLDRLLGNLGYGSRREAQALARAGAVVLDGVAVREARTPIVFAPDLTSRLTVDGAPLDPPAPLTLMLHKPAGVVCSHREPGRSVYDLLPPRWRRRRPVLATIGRLDGDTTGLLLITDDGELAHAIASPRRHLAKRYFVTLAEPLNGSEAGLFASGSLMLPGEAKPLAPARLQRISDTSTHLTITEGRHHQVKRMFAAVGNHVVALHRDRIGDLDLPDDLAPGDYRRVEAADLAALA